MDKSKLEHLAVLQAVYKKLAEMLATGNSGNLRGEIDSMVYETYQQSGADRIALVIGGQKVGEIGVNLTKPKKEVIIAKNKPLTHI